MKQSTQSQCSGTSQRDGVGREVGVGFRMGGYMYTCDPFISMYGKNHHNIIKQLSFNLNKLIFFKKKLSSGYFSCYIYSPALEYQQSCH